MFHKLWISPPYYTAAAASQLLFLGTHRWRLQQLEKLVELGQCDDFRSAIQAFALVGFIKKL
ncbi:MAG: hypothetical protein IPN76_00595 [Saprospiraceae bacterium]|nr:hypothetical protein [Saprospiraceae bacterium]